LNPYERSDEEVAVDAATMETPAIGSPVRSDWAPPQPPQPPGVTRADPPQGSRIKELDLRNTWQIMAGAVLLPLGIAIIILGWHGAAYGNVDQKQIPYLISGGILGLAVVVIGCFFYWAHWLYRIYDQADLHHQEAMREQTEMIKALLEAVQHRPGPVAGAAPSSAAAAAIAGGALAPAAAAFAAYDALDPASTNGSPTFLATPTGTNFHAAGCSMIANRLESVRTVSAKEAEKMRPCRVCEPLNTR
jgi:hypothetical protein